MPDFWKPKPLPPWRDWRTYSLLVPVVASTVGFFVFSIFTYAFDDIAIVPAKLQSAFVILAAICVAFGAEVGTPFTVLEVYRKALKGQANRWDWAAIVVSLSATLTAVLVAFAARIVRGTEWAAIFLEWGPLVVGLVVAADAYGGAIETGFLFADWENRMERWLEESAESAMRDGDNLPAQVAQLRASVARLSWPVARLSDWRRILSGLNGQAASIDYAMAEQLLAKAKLRAPSERTLDRWVGMAEEE